jgi:tetratricopeptide (TPR) repeat protein
MSDTERKPMADGIEIEDLDERDALPPDKEDGAPESSVESLVDEANPGEDAEPEAAVEDTLETLDALEDEAAEDARLDSQDAPADDPENESAESDEESSNEAASQTTADSSAAWERLHAQLERELGYTEDPARQAALHHAIGEILELRLGETERALLHYQQAYAADPSHQPTLKAATRLFKEVGRWDMVIELLEGQDAGTLTELERVGLLIEQAQIYATRLDQRPVAIERLEQALTISPKSATAFKLLEKLYATSGDTGALIEFYNRYIFDPNFADLHLPLLQNLARIQEESEHLQSQAIETYQKIIELDPANLLAISALKRLLVKHRQWERLANVYQQEEKLVRDPRGKALVKYLQARIESDHHNNREAAEALLREGLAIDPDDVLLMDELETIYEASRNWEALVDIHTRQFSQARDRETQVELAFKIGGILQDNLERFDEAAEWYERALNAKPDYLPALHVLGKLYARSGRDDKLMAIMKHEAELVEDARLKAARYFVVAEHAQRKVGDHETAITYYKRLLELTPGYLPAIKALSEMYAYLGRLNDWIAMNELQISSIPNLNREQIIYLLEKNASLWEHMNQPEKAVDCHRRILEHSREFLPSIQALGRLFAQMKDWNNLVEINQLEADLINDQHRIVSLLCKNAEIYEANLADEPRAIDYYRRVLTLSPSYLPAVRALGGIYQRRGNWEELIKMYHRELDAAGQGEQATGIRFKVAQIYDEELNNPQKAEANYLRVLQDDPTFTPALHALTKYYQAQGKWQALIDLYESQLSRIQDNSLKLLSLYKVAELYETRLSDLSRAQDAYQRILELEPRNMAARRGLSRIYSQTNQRAEQLTLINMELEEVDDDSARLSLLIQAADIVSELADHDHDSILTYQQILTLDPDNSIAFQQLERLYRKSGLYADLADLYEARYARLSDDHDRLPLLWITIDVLENHLDDFERLADAYAEAIRIEPYNTRTLAFFEEVYGREGRFEQLLDIYDRQHQLSEDKPHLLQLYVSSGQILELELNRASEALQKYESALALDPDHFPARQGAKRVYAKLEKWTDLVGILEGELERAPSTGAFIATAYQLGYIRETKFNRRDIAADLYIKVLELDPTHKEAYLRAKKLLTEHKEYLKLADIYERRLKTLTVREDQLEMHRQIAQLAEGPLSDLRRAIENRRALMEADPDDLEQKRHLAELYRKNTDWQKAIELYEEIAPRLDDNTQLRDLYFAIGQIYQSELNDHSRAVSSFETVLAYEPNDLQAMERLGDLYKTLKLSEEASEILTKLLGYDLPKEKEIRYNLALGEIEMEQLGNEEKAIGFFERALALDPNNSNLLNTLSALFEKRNRWDQLVGLYEDNLARQQGAARLGLMMGLARLYMEKLGDVDKALKNLARAHAEDPYNLEIQALQARAMGMNALYYLDAIDKHRQLIDQNPFRVESLHELVRIYAERNETDKSFCALMVLDFLKAQTEHEMSRFRQLRDSVTGGIAATIPQREQDRLLIHPGERGLLRDLFLALEPALYKLSPVNLEPYGLPQCKVAGVNSSIYHLMENAAYHLGVDLFKIYISQEQPDLLAVENTKPPTIIMGGNLAFSAEGVKRFIAGRVMSMIRNGHTMFTRQGLDTLRFWVEAACHLYIPEVQVQGATISEVEDFTQSLNRAISKAARKELEETVRAWYKQDVKPDVAAFAQAMQHSDNRMGLLLAGDLVAAAESIVYLETGQPYRAGASTSDIIEAFRNDHSIKELILFTISEAHHELRQLIRVNVG